MIGLPTTPIAVLVALGTALLGPDSEVAPGNGFGPNRGAASATQTATTSEPEKTFEVSARLETPSDHPLRLGEVFRLVIETRHAPGEVALLPENLGLPDDALAERVTARRHTRESARVGDNEIEIDRYVLELLAFELGVHEIPAIPVALGRSTSETEKLSVTVESTLSTDELKVATSTSPAAMAELESMVAADPLPISVFVDDWRLLWTGAITLLLLVIGFVAWRLGRRRLRRKAVAPLPSAPPRPAHEVALDRLEALKKAGLFEGGAHKAFFAEISSILREYAGARYRFDSLDLTVDELASKLSAMRTPELDLGVLEEVLTKADLVKFAKYTPDRAEANRALNAAFDIVEKTRQAIAHALEVRA